MEPFSVSVPYQTMQGLRLNSFSASDNISIRASASEEEPQAGQRSDLGISYLWDLSAIS